MLWEYHLGEGWRLGRLPRGGDLQVKAYRTSRSQPNKGEWVRVEGLRLIFAVSPAPSQCWPRGDQ